MNTKQKRHHALRRHFYRHILRNGLAGLLLIVLALGVGMFGYHVTEDMLWVDAFMNAAMILSGMGPVTTIVTLSGKLFAGFYALFSGLAFLAIVAIMLAPVIHKLFRKIYLENAQKKG